MSIFDDLIKKLKDNMNAAQGGPDITPGQKIHSFLNKKSILKSTSFLVDITQGNFTGTVSGVEMSIPGTKFCDPWQIEDVSLSLPQVEFESVGYLSNQYTFPIIKDSQPIKITMVMADNEDGSLYKNLISSKMAVLGELKSKSVTPKVEVSLINTGEVIGSQNRCSRYVNHSVTKSFGIDINILKSDGNSTGFTISVSNAYITNIDDIKYSYTSLTDYQKYNVTFQCDICDFKLINVFQGPTLPLP